MVLFFMLFSHLTPKLSGNFKSQQKFFPDNNSFVFKFFEIYVQLFYSQQKNEKEIHASNRSIFILSHVIQVFMAFMALHVLRSSSMYLPCFTPSNTKKNRETRNVVFPHQIHYLVSFFFFFILEIVRKNSIIPHWIFLQENTIY